MTPLPPPNIHSSRGDLPVLLSIPHAGREYPDWLVAMASKGREALAVLEDPLVDRLAWRAIGSGIGAVVAQAPRAAVDCNRAEDEVDPSVVAGGRRSRLSARARGGLGIVPGRTQHHGYLWRRSIAAAELEQRLDQAHRPYHAAIEAQLEALLSRFGCALLLDCHSMPPPPGDVPAVIIGDLHGRTSDEWLSRHAVRVANAAGFRAGLNDPFAGGHVIERHGSPRSGIHALQIEIDRRAYLDSAMTGPGPGFDRVASLIQTLATRLGRALLESAIPTAAE